jgi:tetratricopeptide (TPR) repeat protein
MQQGTWNRNRDAIKAFDKAIEIKPQYADAWNNKGLHSKSTFLTPLPAVPLIQKREERGHRFAHRLRIRHKIA